VPITVNSGLGDLIMDGWFLVSISALTVALGFATPASALDLALGSSAASSGSASAGSSHSTFGLGADLGADIPAGGSESGDGEHSAAIDGGARGSMVAALLASQSIDVRIATVIRLIEESSWNESSFEGIDSLTGSVAFEIESWLTADNRQAFDAALEATWPGVIDLHAAIAANEMLSVWLAGAGIPIESIVAVGQAANGSLAVFASGS
jgi:hypothetical protein